MKRVCGFFAAGMGIVCVLLGAHLLRLPHGELMIDFLNIGQGDAVLLTTPDQHTILIDGGPEQTVLEELGAVMPFTRKRIDLMVLTHPHADHMMGLIQVLRRYEVGAVLFSGVNANSPLYETFLQEIAAQKIPLHTARASHDWRLGEMTLDVLFPLEPMLGVSIDNLNNGSVVLLVTYRGHRILLSGDAEEDVEAELLAARVDVSAEVFKAGHHGSRTSSTEPFLDAVNPRVVVIQSGEGNDYGHPHPETLEHLQERAIEVHRNDVEGRVRVVCGEGKYCFVR